MKQPLETDRLSVVMQSGVPLEGRNETRPANLKTNKLDKNAEVIEMKRGIWTLLLTALTAFEAKTEDRTAEDVFREAAKGWERLRSADSHVVGTLHRIFYRKESKTGKGYYRVNRYHDFKIKDRYALVATHSPGLKGQNIQIVNPRYQAQLERSSTASPLVLVGFSFGEVKATKNVVFINSEVYQSLQLHRSLLTIPFERLVSNEHIKFSNVQEYYESGKPRIRIDFSFPSRPKFTSEKEWIVLSPEDDWALLEAKYFVRKDWFVTIRNEVARQANGSILLSNNEEIHHFLKDNIEDIYSCVFTYQNVSDLPDSEFTLSAYGLPEPVEPKSRPTRSLAHFWFIGGGAVLMVFALALRRKARRSME